MTTENLIGISADGKVAAVKGENTGTGGFGILGICATGHGVHGQSTGSKGVVGESQGFHGVFGKSRDNVGVAAESQNAEAMNAVSHSAKHAAIIAINDANGEGVRGRSGGNVGVVGESNTGRGLFGISNTNFGVTGVSKQSTGVFGKAEAGGAGVIGESKSGIGVHGKGGRLAGFFEGDVEVTGDIRLANADCAEDFDVSGTLKVEPGTVMVLGHEGALSESYQAYDKRVAGVISGAGDYKPGIVLDKRQSQGNRQPIALMGKVFCKVDAQYGAIEVGDLLTTSPTPGHAMQTSDPFKAFGAVIGKALRPFRDGQGLIPILIALQ
jgi:hypothetical protein